MFDIHKMLRSFGPAIDGLLALFGHENNAKFHLVVAIVVIFTGVGLKIDASEWALITLAIGGVWASEAFNTALEKLCDLVTPDFHPQVKLIKDLAAAGVLVMALVAFVIGVIIFGQKLMVLIS